LARSLSTYCLISKSVLLPPSAFLHRNSLTA